MKLHRWMAASLAVWALGAQAAVLSWLPPFKETGRDQIAYVDLLFTRQGAERLGGFDLLLQFDPTVLRFSDTDSLLTPANRPGHGNTLAAQLACPGRPDSCLYWGSVGGITGQVDPDDGTIRLVEVSLAPAADLQAQVAQFLLARLAFVGIGMVGQTSPLDLLRFDLADAQGEVLPVQLLSEARVQISIPEPGSAGLVGVALLMLGSASLHRGRAHAMR